MPTVRRYPSPILARAAADYLRRSGVVATVVGDSDALGGLNVGIAPGAWGVPGVGPYAVVIQNDGDRERARRLLAEMEAEPLVPEEGWEAGSLPDLSRLDPALAPPCPACGRVLPLDAAADRCPACGVEADVCALLAARHGPELLAACCAEPEAGEIPGDVLDGAELVCPACSYALRGLPRSGACPECGGWYDKHTLLEAP